MWHNRLIFIESLFLSKDPCHSSNVALLPSETGDLIIELGILLYLYLLSLLSTALASESDESELLLDESELSELLISPLLLLPTVELELVLELELEELEKLSLVLTTPDVDAGIAKTSKASTAFLIEPPLVLGGSLYSSFTSVIVESDESSDSASSLSSSVTASIFSEAPVTVYTV
jgi:hypothetical protein